ncbi:hypothetical protein MUCCIDRAFT_108716 [Mucor lusitanicus CBS 277.49]|uniref:Uncharacterized protein n=1 Tax=Mucor lusitanicus CBS 277.49 TaxID=747725 RepID=A0A162QQF4_MUCCL|nr:hypothetical protein MUCCIDRAFT_108716 [Mucor lusitanicus CBS 277.49]
MTILSNRNLDGPPRHRSNTDDKRDIESASGKNERSKEELNVGEKQHVGMETDTQTKRFINAVAVNL